MIRHGCERLSINQKARLPRLLDPGAVMVGNPVLRVEDLCVTFDTRRGLLKAVDHVGFSLDRGVCLGLVGESGSGKSVTGLAVLGLANAPGCTVTGSIKLDGQELVGMNEESLRSLRGKRIAMIFQDPMTTLNPVLRIDTQIIEAIRAHERMSERAANARAREALARVGIPSPAERLTNYPHQFSGGMRQRIAIAIALLHKPSVLIADEPTTALDVTIQAQVLSEVQMLAEEFGTSMIWITHDLSVVAGLADEIAVMYAGRLVETGRVADVLERPLHPYTDGLIGCVPASNQRGRRVAQISGMMPTMTERPAGCAFAPRCRRVSDACRQDPPLFCLPEGRFHRCFHPLETAGGVS